MSATFFKAGTDDSTEDKEQTQTKEKDEDISLLNLTLKQDIDLLRYDKSLRDTHNNTQKVINLKAMKSKVPITRHEPEPKGLRQAISSKNADKWYKVGEDKVFGLTDMNTWEVSQPIPGVKLIDSKWVFKVKYTPTGEIKKYKGLLVVQGDSQ
jgi:hypothetical protein